MRDLLNKYGRLLKEQFTDKDIVGPCQNKEIFSLFPGVQDLVVPDWGTWAQTLSEVPDNPTFTVTDQTASSLAVNYMMSPDIPGTSNFSSYYFSVVNSIPSDIEEGLPSPMCPYGYVSNITMIIDVNGQGYNFSFFNFPGLIEQVQSSSWGPTLFGIGGGSLNDITNFQEFISALQELNSNETINVGFTFEPITVNMCNCVWTDIIEGCMDQDSCNYDSEAGSDDGSCIPPNLCGSCTGELDCVGCIDYQACNYDGTVSYVNNDLCEYESCVGCQNENATNYNPQATTNVYLGGEFEGEAVKCEFDPNVTDWQGPYSPSTDPDYGPGGVDIGVDPNPVGPFTPGRDPVKPDVSLVPDYITDKPLDKKPGYVRPTGLDKPSRPGDEELIPISGSDQGCTNPESFNYDEGATTDDGSCISPGDPCVVGWDWSYVPGGGLTEYNGILNSEGECVAEEPEYCNQPSGVCLEECEQFNCQSCFNNYVNGSAISPTFTYTGPGNSPFGGGPCGSFNNYNSSSNAGNPINNSGGNVYNPTGRPGGANPGNYGPDVPLTEEFRRMKSLWKYKI